MQELLHSVSRWSTQGKITALLLTGYVLLPLCLLIGLGAAGEQAATNALVAYLTIAIILFYPFSRAASSLIAKINIERINAYCQKIKQGKFDDIGRLPPERGDERDFPRLERNLHWMGHALGVRERKLASALEGLEKAQGRVLESIEYASLIQKSFLPQPERLEALLPERFIWWDQRDAVGGDCCWIREGEGGFFLGVVDCTGHGVPGAFMTLIVTALFDRLEMDEIAGDPAGALGRLNRLVKSTLGKDAGSNASDDGMDAALCWIEPGRGRLVFAGANRPLFVLGQGGVREIAGDRRGVGYLKTPEDAVFTNREIQSEPGDAFYMFTDGLVDQVGGPKNFPLGRKKLREALWEWRELPMPEQKRRLREMFETYMGREPRRDDVTALGFKLDATDRADQAGRA